MAEMTLMAGAEALSKSGKYGEDGDVDDDTLYKGTFYTPNPLVIKLHIHIWLTRTLVIWPCPPCWLHPFYSTPSLPSSYTGLKMLGQISGDIALLLRYPSSCQPPPTLSTPHLKYLREIPAPEDTHLGHKFVYDSERSHGLSWNHSRQIWMQDCPPYPDTQTPLWAPGSQSHEESSWKASGNQSRAGILLWPEVSRPSAEISPSSPGDPIGTHVRPGTMAH